MHQRLFKKSIAFISANLHDEEWLKIYPVPSLWGDISVNVKVGSTSTSLDFLYEIIPLGANLIQLQDLAGFSRIVNRLDIPSYERISTIFEVRVAATYKGSGYTVDLEPQNGKGGRCDLRIMSKGLKDWLYIECKAQNPIDSEIIKRRQKFISELSNQIYSEVKMFLGAQDRIEVQLPSWNIQMNKKNNLIKNIVMANRKKEIGQWMEFYSIKYRISERKNPPEIPANHVMSGGVVPLQKDTAVPLTATAVHITCPLGNVIKNALNLITDARKQLSEHSRGLIALKMLNGSAILNHIIKRSEGQLEKYEKIVAIIIIDDNRLYPITNKLHNDIPDAVLRVPSFLCAI